jgi:hypothetical protein
MEAAGRVESGARRGPQVLDSELVRCDAVGDDLGKLVHKRVDLRAHDVAGVGG